MFIWTRAVVIGHKVDFWNRRIPEGNAEHVETVSAMPDRKGFLDQASFVSSRNAIAMTTVAATATIAVPSQ